jgi:hypothetical protein
MWINRGVWRRGKGSKGRGRRVGRIGVEVEIKGMGRSCCELVSVDA